MSTLHSFRDLIVWQKSIALVRNIYTVTKEFPKEELFGLTSQMRRAAVSIPSNIAEGRHRSTKKEFCHFLQIAYASAAELETQMEIALVLDFCTSSTLTPAFEMLREVQKMLNVMRRNILKADS